MLLLHSISVVKMSTNTCSSSRIIEVYKGKAIRNTNRVTLLFGAAPYKAILDAVESTGLSFHQVLGHSGKPCEKCKGLTIAIYDERGDPKYIKKGLINIPSISSGENTFKWKGSKKIMNTDTGKVHDSIKEVSRVYNINYSTLCWKLRGLINNDTPFIYAEITSVNSENIPSAGR